jgi:hypothetical protein
MTVSDHPLPNPRSVVSPFIRKFPSLTPSDSAPPSFRTLLQSANLETRSLPLNEPLGKWEASADVALHSLSDVSQHGEPGAAVADMQPVDAVVSHVLQKILDPVSIVETGPFCKSSPLCESTVCGSLLVSCLS